MMPVITESSENYRWPLRELREKAAGVLKNNGGRIVPCGAPALQTKIQGVRCADGVSSTGEVKESDSHSAPVPLRMGQSLVKEEDDRVVHPSARLVGKLEWVQSLDAPGASRWRRTSCSRVFLRYGYRTGCFPLLWLSSIFSFRLNIYSTIPHVWSAQDLRSSELMPSRPLQLSSSSSSWAGSTLAVCEGQVGAGGAVYWRVWGRDGVDVNASHQGRCKVSPVRSEVGVV